MWFPPCQDGMELQDLSSTRSINRSKANEEEPKDLEVGISIRGLTKVYNEVSDLHNAVLQHSNVVIVSLSE